MKARLAAAGFVLLANISSAQVRDVPGTRAGTMAISGIVVDDLRQPVRRALVRIDGAASVPATMVTDSDGRFAFYGLSAGRYSLSASKASYVTARYGANRPGRPGTSLVLPPARPANDIVLVLARGAVIAGRIVSADGEPARAIPLRVLRSRFGPGGRSFGPLALSKMNGTLTTDDLGSFRIFGLEPGDYILGAAPRTTGTAVQLVTAAEIDRAERDLQTARAAGLGRGAGSAPQTAMKRVAYAPVYYPGTVSMTEATPISLAVAEERSGIDFRVDLVATTTVEGVVTRADGQSPLGVVVHLFQATEGQGSFGMTGVSTTSGINGVFRFESVVPGQYVVAATLGPGFVRATSAGVSNTIAFQGSPPAAGAETMTSATTSIFVSEGGASGIAIALRSGVNLSGRVQFAGTVLSAADLSRVGILLSPIADANQITRGLSTVRANAASQFTMSGITPGRYTVDVNVAAGVGSPGSNWRAASVVVNGREVIDTGLEVTGNETVLEAVLTLTDRNAELAGVFQDASGQPAPDYTVVLFTTDRSLWRWQSRRIKAVRPSSDGKFLFPDLPAGEYFLTAVTDVEPNEWFDPEFLDLVTPASIRLTVADGEKKVQDIRIR